MIHPWHKGKRYWMYTNWKEVPASLYHQYRQISDKNANIGDNLVLAKDQYLSALEMRFKSDDSECFDNFLEYYDLEYYEDRHSDLKNEYIEMCKIMFDKWLDWSTFVKIDLVALFSNIPRSVLMKMDRTVNSKNEYHQDNLHYYSQKLALLSSAPLPSVGNAIFDFQSRTDEEIGILRSQVKKIESNFYRRIKISREDKAIKKQFALAKNNTFKVLKPHQMTTMMNDRLKNLLNKMVLDMARGDWSKIVNFVALVTIEGQFDSQEILEAIDDGKKSTLLINDHYDAIITSKYLNRIKLFSQQKNKLSIWTAIEVLNYFFDEKKNLSESIQKPSEKNSRNQRTPDLLLKRLRNIMSNMDFLN